jgi:hypothetical protein
MAELDVITESLRRQRRDLDDLVDETLSRRSETAALLDQIEGLRARAERSQRVYQAQADQSAVSKPKKK